MKRNHSRLSEGLALLNKIQTKYRIKRKSLVDANELSLVSTRMCIHSPLPVGKVQF